MTHDAISNRLTAEDEARARDGHSIAFGKEHAQAPGPVEDDDVDIEEDDDLDEDDEDLDDTDAEPELE